MQFFITSTGTDIGKTFVLTNICQKLIAEGKKVTAIKPIISGFKDQDPNSDSAKILQVLGLDFTSQNLNNISPYRFLAPLAPNIAAALENKDINFDELIQFCQKYINQAEQDNSYLLIEGAGGVMTPITDDKVFADLIADLNIPTILVVGNYLGTISHTLTAIKAMSTYNIKIAEVILNIRDDDNVDAQDTLKVLRKFTNLKISTIAKPLSAKLLSNS
jgi:dethiobiotin synthetase